MADTGAEPEADRTMEGYNTCSFHGPRCNKRVSSCYVPTTSYKSSTYLSTTHTFRGADCPIVITRLPFRAISGPEKGLSPVSTRRRLPQINACVTCILFLGGYLRPCMDYTQWGGVRNLMMLECVMWRVKTLEVVEVRGCQGRRVSLDDLNQSDSEGLFLSRKWSVETSWIS